MVRKWEFFSSKFEDFLNYSRKGLSIEGARSINDLIIGIEESQTLNSNELKKCDLFTLYLYAEKVKDGKWSYIEDRVIDCFIECLNSVRFYYKPTKVPLFSRNNLTRLFLFAAILSRVSNDDKNKFKNKSLSDGDLEYLVKTILLEEIKKMEYTFRVYLDKVETGVPKNKYIDILDDILGLVKNKYIIINFNYTTYYEQYYMIDSKKSNSGEIFDPEIIHIHGIREPIFGVDINDKKYRDNLLEFTKTFKVMYSDEFVLGFDVFKDHTDFELRDNDKSRICFF